MSKQALETSGIEGGNAKARDGMTSTRRRVLETLRAADKPLGAYDILAQLNASGRRAQAPAAYRALDFLVSRGLAHKLSTRRAYIACDRPEGAHTAAFMICRRCGRVIETCLAARRGPLDDAANAVGFAIERTVLEVEGVCADCRTSSGA